MAVSLTRVYPIAYVYATGRDDGMRFAVGIHRAPHLRVNGSAALFESAEHASLFARTVARRGTAIELPSVSVTK